MISLISQELQAELDKIGTREFPKERVRRAANALLEQVGVNALPFGTNIPARAREACQIETLLILDRVIKGSITGAESVEQFRLPSLATDQIAELLLEATHAILAEARK